MPALELLAQPDEVSDLACAFSSVVGTDADEADLAGGVDVPQEVGHEDDRSVQYPDQHGFLSTVVAVDESAELSNTCLDLLGGDEGDECLVVDLYGFHGSGKGSGNGHSHYRFT